MSKQNKLVKKQESAFQNDPNWEKAREIEFGKKERIRAKNPITGVEKSLVIDRGGISDNKLARVLKSGKNQDFKNAQIIQYLSDNNADALAMLGEMFRMKGYMTKETRQFKSQMRFDFEMFVSTFTTFLRDTSELVWGQLFRGTEYEYKITDILEEYEQSKSLPDIWDEKDSAIASLALGFKKQADSLDSVVKKITEQRERAKGKGIYIDKLGRAHSLYDEDLLDIIKSEKEELAKKKDEK